MLGESLALGLTEADGDFDGLVLADGDSDGEEELDGLVLADGLTDADGDCEAEADVPWLASFSNAVRMWLCPVLFGCTSSAPSTSVPVTK